MKGKIWYDGLNRPMEEVMGADPTSSGWKPDILAGKLYLHKGHKTYLIPQPLRPKNSVGTCLRLSLRYQ